MKIIKGYDEIRCVLRNIVPIYSIIDIGLGTNDISRMDGPAFHLASTRIFELKKEKLIFDMSTSNKIWDDLLSNNINLIYLLNGKWLPTKVEIMAAYEKWSDQRKVARNLDISQQTVSYHLKSSNWKEIKMIEGKLKLVLKRLGQHDTGT